MPWHIFLRRKFYFSHNIFEKKMLASFLIHINHKQFTPYPDHPLKLPWTRKTHPKYQWLKITPLTNSQTFFQLLHHWKSTRSYHSYDTPIFHHASWDSHGLCTNYGPTSFILILVYWPHKKLVQILGRTEKII